MTLTFKRILTPEEEAAILAPIEYLPTRQHFAWALHREGLTWSRIGAKMDLDPRFVRSYSSMHDEAICFTCKREKERR